MSVESQLFWNGISYDFWCNDIKWEGFEKSKRGEKNKGCEGGKVRVRKPEEKKVKRKYIREKGMEMKECYRFT